MKTVTTSKPMMACGHAANSESDGKPACVICAPSAKAHEPAPDQPDLTGRVARCSCGAERPSSTALAFFEFLGEGSRTATDTCGICHYALVAHTPEGVARNADPRTMIEKGRCTGFVPQGGVDHDRFYCGCRGWD